MIFGQELAEKSDFKQKYRAVEFMSQLKSQTKQNQGMEAMRQGRKVPKTNLKLSNVSHEAVGILSKKE